MTEGLQSGGAQQLEAEAWQACLGIPIVMESESPGKL